MDTGLRVWIETAIARWQRDLGEGREVRMWRESAARVGKERGEGKLDGGVGKRKGENGELKDEKDDSRNGKKIENGGDES